MHAFRRHAVTLLATAGIVTIVVLVTGWGSAVASDIHAVFVTNTPAQPVPVKSVGPVDVNVTGTPTVAIASAPTLQTAAADNPAFQPFSHEFDYTFPSGTGSGYPSGQGYTVPKGKILVVEQVAWHAALCDRGDQAGFVVFGVDDGTPAAVDTIIPMASHFATSNLGGFQAFVQGFEETHMYLPQGHAFTLDLEVTGPGGSSCGNGNVTVYGHFVDAP